MAIELDQALNEVVELFNQPSSLVRVVLSGRRRNMQVESERIDIRPVQIKEKLAIQVASNDGRQTTTKNYAIGELDFKTLIASGYANILIESTNGAISLRITKKGEALIHRDGTKYLQNLEHDRSKARLLAPSDPFLIEVGISDAKGVIKPSRQDKYLQVEEFLRLLIPTLNGAISAGQIHQPTKTSPIVIADLGCGNAYLTFAAHQYLTSVGIPVKVIGVDIRPDSFKRNSEVAGKLGISGTIEFRAEAIDNLKIEGVDIAIALHACDTATDDALAWAIACDTKLILVAPCCQHDLQTQMVNSPEPWNLLTKFGLIKERLGDLLTDSLRAAILKNHGYRSEIIEFIGGEHTPRNIIIRAVKTNAAVDAKDKERYEELINLWGVKPALEERLSSS
jgi:SAM-dependent methyltransferase